MVLRVFLTIMVLIVLAVGAVAKELVEKPLLFPELGHTDPVETVTFSPDGRFALSGSSDLTIKLWDSASGKEIRTFNGHTGSVTSVAFTPDMRHVLSLGSDGNMKLWDIASGREIWTYKGKVGRVVAISPDGRYALSWEEDVSINANDRINAIISRNSEDFTSETLKLWDISTGKKIRSFAGHSARIRSVAISHDGRYALSGSHDGRIKLWDIASGKEIRSFGGQLEDIHSIAFSPDGRYALSGHAESIRSISFYSDGRSAISEKGDNTLKLWDVASGKEIRTFLGHENSVNSVAFSPDGGYVLSGGDDRKIKLWDRASGRELQTFEGHVHRVTSVAFSPDGRYALSGSGDNTLKLWDIASGKESKALTGHSTSIISVAFSPDGRYALSGKENNTLKTRGSWDKDSTIMLWDLAIGKEVGTFTGLVTSVNSVAFSPDGKYALFGKEDNTLKLWDIASGREIRTFTGHSGKIDSVAFSPDGLYALSGSRDGEIILWDSTTGKVIKTFSGYSSSITFSPDGRYALSGSGSIVELWDIASGKVIRKFHGPSNGRVIAVVFSSDGRRIISADGMELSLYDISSGKTNQVLRYNWSADMFSPVAFSPDKRYALSVSKNNRLALWDIANTKIIKEFAGHSRPITSIAFSADGKYALTGGRDGTIRKWHIDNGEELSQFITFTDGEWVAITSEGYYNSSVNGHLHLNISQGMEVYGIDQFYDVFYRPDIVQSKLAGEDISLLIRIKIEDAMKSPPPSVKFTKMPGDTNESKVKVCYQITSTGGGIGEVRLFQNGKLIKSDGFYRENIVKKTMEKRQLVAINSRSIQNEMRGLMVVDKKKTAFIVSKPKSKSFEECEELEPVHGENEISVTAFNAGNTIQSYMQTTSFKSTRRQDDPHLYILAVGIDKYRDASVNLKYAAKDASDFISMLPEKARNLYKPGNIHLETLLDAKANRTSILQKIDELSHRIKPADSFILFVASHGVLVQEQYFIVTYDYNGNVDDINTLISSNQVVEMSKKIKSLSQLLIFDTCHAGGVDNIISGLYDSRMSVMAKKMGLHIYASAGSIQSAMDGYQGNGLYTHALLQGIANGTDVDRDKSGTVTIKSLGMYSKEKTMDISTKLGYPQTPLIINFGRDNQLFKVKQ